MTNHYAKDISIQFDDITQNYFVRKDTPEVYVPVTDDEFTRIIPLLPENGIVLISLFAIENFQGTPGFTLLYAFEKRGCPNIVFLQRSFKGNLATSIASYFPSACWFEREVRDGFGIEFKDSFDKRRLFLHESYPPKFNPLLKSFQNRDIADSLKDLVSPDEYAFKEVRGEGIYQIPVGPVHAGIIEPGHFRFSVIGETICALEIRMFYKHRGIEKLAENKTPIDCVNIAESISGDESVANAVAFCMAIEKIGRTKVPERAWYLRTILLEMERIYSHLGDLSGMLVDVAFPVGAADFSILREEILRYNEILTGSRFLKGIVRPGGLKKDIPSKILLMLTDYFEPFMLNFRRATNFALHTNSVIDRLETTGVIRKELINPLNITGPAARSAGVSIDNRADHPYGIYPSLNVIKRTGDKGDVLSRFEVKVAEIVDSVNLIRKIIAEIKTGEISVDPQSESGYALSLVEAARGQNLHWVNLKKGVVDRYKIRTASFCNWQSIEHAVIGNIVPDFPLINKSLNLSYAGTDL